MVTAGDCLHMKTNLSSLRHEVESISVHPFMNECHSEGETQKRVGERLDATLLEINNLIGRPVG